MLYQVIKSCAEESLEMKTLIRIFINRNYGLLFMGRLVSQIGDGVHYFAVVWLVLDITKSGTVLGALLIAAAIPRIALTPFSGVLADIWNRKKIVVLMDFVRGALLLVTAVIYALDRLTLPVIFIVTILLSLCGALFSPAILATIPGLVKREDLTRANSRDIFSNSATGIIGPIIGAFLLSGFGYLGIFIINGVSFIISAISEMFIQFPVQTRTGENAAGSKAFVHNMKDGFHYLWHKKGLQVLLGVGFLLFFLFYPLFSVVFPYFSKEILKMTPEFFGFAQASFPLGMLLGAVFSSRIANRFTKVRIMVTGIVLQAILVIGLGFIAFPSIYHRLSSLAILAIIAVPFFIMGAMNVNIYVPFNVLVQESVSEDYRGRIFSLFSSANEIAVPLGIGIYGVLIDFIPINVFLFICGALAVVMAIKLASSRSLHKLAEKVDS